MTTEYEWVSPEDAPACLSFHLKTITICNFYGGVKYLLENAKVLEKMTMCPCNKSEAFVENLLQSVSREIDDVAAGLKCLSIKFCHLKNIKLKPCVVYALFIYHLGLAQMVRM